MLSQRDLIFPLNGSVCSVSLTLRCMTNLKLKRMRSFSPQPGDRTAWHLDVSLKPSVLFKTHGCVSNARPVILTLQDFNLMLYAGVGGCLGGQIRRKGEGARDFSRIIFLSISENLTRSAISYCRVPQPGHYA